MEIMDIKSFNNACDEFLAGKYILAEVKIASILREIANNEKLKNIVSNALENYEFKTEFSKHIGGDEEQPTLTLPKSEKEIISFVYSLLYTFDKKQISLYDFLRKFYANDNNHGQEVYSFATNILEKGCDIKTLSELLGHTQPSTSLNMYCHTRDELKRNAIKLLNVS